MQLSRNRLPNITIIVMTLCLILSSGLLGQDKVYNFTVEVEQERTSVKNQFRTSTCWSFATLSFLESELLRMGKGEFDLSEMFVVRHTWPLKAKNYIRHMGSSNFSPGGMAHDVIDMIRRYGIVPNEVYPGIQYGEKRHNHGELDAVLDGMMEAVNKVRGKRITPVWMNAFESVVEAYLGEKPESFVYKGKKYTPESFRDDVLGLNLDDYIEITSYSCYPFWEKCHLQIPDNWSFYDDYYNVPIDDLERIMDHALKNGYTICWDGDMSERFFESKRKGWAVIPKRDWEDKTVFEQDAEITEPIEEKEIDQALRQWTFDNRTTTDDHLMHVVGIARDQNNTKFYITKNSWGTGRVYGGYTHMSRSYVRLKTVFIMVNKNSLPKDIAKKLGIK